MHSVRAAYLPRNPTRVALSLLMVLALVCMTLAGTDVSAGAAQAELPTRLETALSAAGVTVDEVRFGSAAGRTSGDDDVAMDITYREWRGFVRVTQTSSPEAAQNLVVGSGVLKKVRINGATGYVGTVNETMGQLGQVTFSTANWARDDSLAEATLWGSTDTDALLALCEIVDDVLSGATGSGSGIESGAGEPSVPPEESGLVANASPSSFAKPGDSATVRVTLTGPDVTAKPVTLVGHGLDLRSVTDAGGAASFSVKHDDETLAEYRFAVSCEGMTREVVIPVSVLDIHPEIEARSGKPYSGVVADGLTSLVLEIDVGGATGGTLRVASPELGTLSGTALGSDGVVSLANGKAAVEFTPPAYVAGDHMADRVVPPETTGATIGSARGAQTVYVGGGSPWAAKVPITFTHTTEEGRETEVVVDVLVARAPVLLIHGFGGGKATWAALQQYLGERRFDAIINEYYTGDQGIHDQARALSGDISREIDRYASLGLKMSRVDIVGHSMGGLIARDYVYGLPPHPSDVRKVIMVGTPNHGASFVDKLAGNVLAEMTAKHPLASEQLYSGSAFLAQLNGGEVAGRHLNPEVQYGNIYGVRSDYVVTGSSAYLNGVASHIVSGATHSTDIPFPGVPITASDTINNWIIDWLGRDIPRAALRGTRVRIVDGEGDVLVSGIETFGETLLSVSSYPHDVQPWEHVVTGSSSRARVRLSVDGLAWGSIDLAPDTTVALGNLTPDSVTVRVRKGSARFRSLKREGGGHFEVVICETGSGEWTTLYPDAKVIGLDTDFVVSADGAGQVETLVLEGRTLFADSGTPIEDEMLALGTAQAGAVGVARGYTSQLVEHQWWTDGFYRASFIEVLQEWWAIVWSTLLPKGGE